MAYLSNLYATYFANATAARDYRVQLRGSRSLVLFGVYLSVLIGVAFTVYARQSFWGGFATQTMSIVAAQRELRNFYMTVVGLLATMIALIAPTLAATTVCQERLRRSFDLVFSAPVTPKYYLVGKAISCYRFVWMLLALSLPITATSVVLGGATWFDVLITYLLLSLQGLLYTTFALMMSALAPKPVSAVVWTYAAMLFYLLFATSIPGLMVISMRASTEQSFIVAMTPVGAMQGASTHMTMFGHEVPNWITASIVMLMFVRLFLLTAGSLLSAYGSKEGRNLRINALLYSFAVAAYLGGAISRSGTGSLEQARTVGIILFTIASILCIFLPFMSCFSYEDERLHWPNGLFKLRRMFDGTPAGALPIVWAFLTTVCVGLSTGVYLSVAKWPSLALVPYLLFAIGFWTFFWAIGRWTSLTGNLKSARTLQFGVFMLLVILPVPFISILTSSYSYGEVTWPWHFYILYPLTVDKPEALLYNAVYGLVFGVVGWMIAVKAERRYAPRVRKDLVDDERLYA